MSTAARAWLASRFADAPPSLAQAMDRALDVAPAQTSTVRALADAALAALQAALQAGDERAGALHLLAADGLLTSACEAALESPADARVLAERFGPERLAAMFAAQLSSGGA